MKECTEDQWVETYGPQRNDVCPGQGFGYDNGNEEPGTDTSCLYGTTPAEMKKITEAGECRVWTVMDGDEGETVIASGFHHVNRLGYILTDKPWVEDMEIILED